MATKGYADLSLYRRLLHRVRPYGLLIAVMIVVDLLACALKLLTPVPLKIAVDSLVGQEASAGILARLMPGLSSGTGVILFAAVFLVVIALLGSLQSLASNYLHAWIGEKMVLDFRGQLFRHGQRLSLAYHDSVGTSDSTYRIQYDASSIQYIAIDGIIPFLTESFTVALMLFITLRLDWQLGLIALAITPVLFLVAKSYRKKLRKQSHEVKQLESSALSVVQEVLGALRVVKAFGQEDREQDRFVRYSRQGLKARLKLLSAEGAFGLLVGMTTAIGTASVLFIGMSHVQSGKLTLGDLLLVMGYLAQLYEPLKTISRKAASLQAHLASAERAFSLLDEAPDVAEKPDTKPLERAAGAVAFRGVSFAYGSERPVLQEISFDIEPGMRVGILGSTGAGKTTLVNLLTRFYDPTTGQVLLDGVDLRDYKLADLRSQFAIVLQDPVLFSTTIAENIAYALPEAGEREIIAAARAAHIHNFIASLPDGYGTLVGERGMRLSGGERQRISLARAFLKDAPILILDEPTSSVDMQTESEIMEAMERLMHGRTTFMIAHRLSTLKHCDLLIGIELGRVVDLRHDVSKAIHDRLMHSGLAAR